ncbi:MAG: HD-GYP domain-containing protein [Actinocrinis sp.]
MLRRRADAARSDELRPKVAIIASLGCLAACGVVIALSRPDRVNTLSIILGIAAFGAGFLVGGERGGLGVSASFIVGALAAAFLGPLSAVIAMLISECTATAVMRTRWRVVIYTNLPPAVASAVVMALIIRALSDRPSNTVGFYLAVVLAAAVAPVLSFGMFTSLRRLAFPSLEQFGLKALVAFLPSAGLSILLAVAGVAVTITAGRAWIGFALAAVFAFAYMVHLLEQSRRRAQQYVSLSWGVLAGLMRALDIRDERAARHSAAVARFARDIAQAVGMNETDCELAHTAGLLHDIGRFGLSDRVAERGRTLTDEDWMAIQRHPELGADMLRDLGMYGPVAEIVLSHHERVDGRGYPAGLQAEEIPEIAKIIAVAEIYDTLTASDTYRTRMSSFEALTELRRVAGTQVESRYVEILAGLLSGEGVEYRHADMADFDVELDMERRINQAGAGG